jgi:(1->4)-alpha-D-glucan 1-alpha-D-glucosylmutase
LASVERAPLPTIATLVAQPYDGRIKMLVTTLGLRHRRRFADLFASGSYVSLEARGPRDAQIVAFLREKDAHATAVVTGRFFTRLGDAAARPIGNAWGDTEVTLPPKWRGRSVRDAFTGETFRPAGNESTSILLTRAFAHLPVAMLEVLP